MPATSEFLASTPGKITSVALIAIVVALGAFLVWRSFGPAAEVVDANKRWFVDIKTGQSFRADLEKGMRIPIKAPSGENTGYLAELCFWKADGSTRTEPFAVVLNAALGKPEPTFCPDCGRLVVGHNPGPTEGRKPPPKKDEYTPRRGTREQ